MQLLNQFADLLIALAICFSVVWMLLNARRAARIAFRWLPQPIRTLICIYQGWRMVRRWQRLQGINGGR